MTSYAYYRLPYADSYYVVESDNEPLVLSSLESIGTNSGFVISPFTLSAECPAVLIRPDHFSIVRMAAVPGVTDSNHVSLAASDPTADYVTAFTAFNDAVRDGSFNKLVLARKLTVPYRVVDREDGQRLFEQACLLYPRLTIMLFSTSPTGTWLIASPEILIEGEGDNYHTVALAGTMPYSEGYPSWSEKNKREQHVVEQYVADTISPLATGIVKDGPVTMWAGNLIHLRTDFRFHLKEGTPLGSLVSRLHPTPAVCGFPKHAAQEFVLQHEGLYRRYYSGFAGPVGINGETHLYVSLRCAELHDDTAVLYAGGGIMPDSSCQSEWHETEQKMKTIMSALSL